MIKQIDSNTRAPAESDEDSRLRIRCIRSSAVFRRKRTTRLLGGGSQFEIGEKFGVRKPTKNLDIEELY